ncbi:hypothetical protein EVAR_81390_1 [Eumeta japonica]|uniref:Uncharacterized protein n=1 Tax=Eumeta variegata TaxID=151549 RepID=A0A4C1WF57_EUMVA|nr:hypothetical protein EVAR_81390_1 [Eumeta japonica]
MKKFTERVVRSCANCRECAPYERAVRSVAHTRYLRGRTAAGEKTGNIPVHEHGSPELSRTGRNTIAEAATSRLYSMKIWYHTGEPVHFRAVA